MKILYVGDVMGEAGLQVAKQVIPKLRIEKKIDLVIAQAENVSDGKGITLKDFERLRKSGVDFCTGGNWSLYHDEIVPAMNDPKQAIIRPANYPEGTPGLGWKYINDVLIVSLLGQIVGKDSDKPVDNPLLTIDKILEAEKTTHKIATIVNFHGDYSSEKVIVGHYLDGRVTAVIGDHWHVPTADARVLPKGTAHVTDVGMCGVLNASLGIKFDSVIPRWLGQKKTRNVLETEGSKQFNAVLVQTDKNGLAAAIEQLQQVF